MDTVTKLEGVIKTLDEIFGRHDMLEYNPVKNFINDVIDKYKTYGEDYTFIRSQCTKNCITSGGHSNS